MEKAERIYKVNRNIFAISLLLWPFISFASVFLLDDPNITGFADILRRYVAYSSFLYPLFVLSSWLLSKIALKNKKNSIIVGLLSFIPLLSGLPWLFLYIAYGYYGVVTNNAKEPHERVFEQQSKELFSDPQLIKLATAAKKGNIATIKNICTPKIVNNVGKNGYTPLIFGLDNINVFTSLLKCGANPNTIFNNGSSIMSLATAMKDEKFIKKSIEFNGNPNIKYKSWLKKEHILFLAATVNQNRALLLISLGADINETDEDGNTFIMDLVTKDNYKLAYKMLQSGANTKITNIYGNTLKTKLIKKTKILKKTHEKYLGANKILIELE